MHQRYYTIALCFWQLGDRTWTVQLSVRMSCLGVLLRLVEKRLCCQKRLLVERGLLVEEYSFDGRRIHAQWNIYDRSN